MAQSTAEHGMRVFITIWLGQLISAIGSGLTGFALGLWVYQTTGLVTRYTLIALFSSLPGILISPLAGALVDRQDRRWVMIRSDIGGGLITLAMAFLFFVGRLEVWHIYLAMGAKSVLRAFRLPAFSATTSLLAPKRHLGRVNGLTQTGEAITQIITPILAGMLVMTIKIPGVLLIDFVSFLFPVLSLLIVRIPQPEAEAKPEKSSLLRAALRSWTYIAAQPGLLSLLLFLAVANFTKGIALVLFTPLMLSYTTAAVLGTVLSLGGCGMLAGSFLMSIWGGPQRRVYGIFGAVLLQGVLLFLVGLRPSTPLIAASAFGFLFLTPIWISSSQTIWQTKVAPALQGRVFAIRWMITWSSTPLAYLIAGPLVDKLFEPLVAVGGPLAASIGRITGVGRGRGIGLMYVTMGILTILSAVAGYLYPRLRRVEDELPDTISERPSVRPADNNHDPVKRPGIGTFFLSGKAPH